VASEIHLFQVTVPIGVAKAAPAVFPLTMPFRFVEQINVRVPPGPRGEVGFAVGAAGLAILPQEVGAFVVADSQYITWPLTRQISSGAWQLLAYNTGSFPHTLQVEFLTNNPLDSEAVIGFVPIVASDLNAG
jgi:hypothetical protein